MNTHKTPKVEITTSDPVKSPKYPNPTIMIRLDIVNEQFAAWINTFRPRCNDIKNGTTGITCEPVSPFKKPVQMPEMGASLYSNPLGNRRSGLRNEKPHHMSKTRPKIILAVAPSVPERIHRPNNRLGMVASSIGQNRSIVDLN